MLVLGKQIFVGDVVHFVHISWSVGVISRRSEAWFSLNRNPS